MQQRRNPDVNRVPQRRRALGLQFGLENREELAVIGCEIAGVELNPVRKAADACLVAWLQRIQQAAATSSYQGTLMFSALNCPSMW